MLWDVDDTLLCDNRTRWVMDVEVWEKQCLRNNPMCSHLLLSAGTTSDVFDNGPLSRYNPYFGVPDSMGHCIWPIPGRRGGRPSSSFTLQGIKGISTNPASRGTASPHELYLDCTKLEFLLALVAGAGRFDRVLFVDNSLHELGLLNGEFQMLRTWLRTHGGTTRAQLIHLRLSEGHGVVPTPRGLIGLPDREYRRLVDRATKNDKNSTPWWGRINNPSCVVALGMQHSAALENSFRAGLSPSCVMSHTHMIDHHMRCRLLLLMRLGIGIQEMRRQFRNRMHMLLLASIKADRRGDDRSHPSARCRPPESTERSTGMDPS